MIRSKSACLTALVTGSCVAALAVAILIWAGLLISALVAPGDGGVSSVVGLAAVVGMIAGLYGFAISFPVFFVGLIVIGIPTWWVLHRNGLKGRGTFIAIGALESVVFGALVFQLVAPGSGVWALLLAIPGGLAGWAIRTYGYVPIKPPPAPPS